MINAASLAQALGGRKSGSGWIAPCPAHDDKHPSLSISESTDGTVLVYCHAGCEQKKVLDALRSRGLWPDATPEQRLAAERREHEANRDHAETVKAIGEADIASGKSKEWSADTLQEWIEAKKKDNRG